MAEDLPGLPFPHSPRARGASRPHRHVDQVPAAGNWVRVQTLVDESGWLAVLAMAGQRVYPQEIAEDEAARLRGAGAEIRRDGSGRPCADPADPKVVAWLRELDERVTEVSARIEAVMQEALSGG